jgi:hypothetical protein
MKTAGCHEGNRPGNAVSPGRRSEMLDDNLPHSADCGYQA